MIAKKVAWVFVLSVLALSCGARVRAADNPLQELDPEIAQRFGKGIAEKFTKEHKNLQLKIDADVEKAVGLFNPDSNEGIIAIPVKNWKEDRDNKETEKDLGAPMCYLFMSQTYNPLVDGKPIDGKKLRKIKFGNEGEEREVTCLLCSVKHVDVDDWELLVFGADKEPLVKAQWGEAPDAPKGGIALTVADPKNDKANLVFNIFGKYSASLQIGTKQK